jgi:hypothetical protein
MSVRRGWLVMLALIVQLFVIYGISDPTALTLKKTLLAISGAMLLVGIIPNLRWWAFRVMAAGFLLNAIVMASNGGLMPISPENARRVLSEAELQALAPGQTPPHSKSVLLPESDTRLRFLSDTIYLSFPIRNAYSPGDVLLAAGLVTFVVEYVTRARPK